ncbi:response regulator transcription factor [Candidatus Peregrinibacteria bacterium]|nr:response regulator transcription factor [Candidatus Peregrinibacteria bacterium]
MEAIILHLPGKRIGKIIGKLQNENIKTKSIIWTPEKSLNGNIVNANMVLLHLTSPERNILSALPDLRKKKYLMPVAVLDESENMETKKIAFDMSADGYFSKPFSYIKLATELKHLVCRKAVQHAQRWLKACNLWLNLENRFVRREDQIIPLRNKEFSLLEYFIINRGKILTRNSILEYVWDRNANFASNTVDVHVNRLRRKIDDPFHDKLIHTVYCVGYIFDKRKKSGK